MKTELSEEQRSSALMCASCDVPKPQVEKSQKNEKASSESSWIILRRHELEVISRFLNVAQKSIDNIKDVIFKCQADE